MLWKIAHLWILSWLFHVLPNKIGDFPVPSGQFQHQVTETVGMMEPCEPPHFGPVQNYFRCFRLYWGWFSVGFTTLHFWGDHSPRVWLASPVTKIWCNNMGTGCPGDFFSISPGWFVQFLGCSSSIESGNIWHRFGNPIVATFSSPGVGGDALEVSLVLPSHS